jgi:flagellar motor component MotA
MQIVQSYFIRNPNAILAYGIAALVVTLSALVGAIIMYFPLKALAHILRILMEMEFKSRKGI